MSTAAERPEPGALEPCWSYVRTSDSAEYWFDMYKADGSDNLHFVDPRDDPQPWELRDGCLDLGLNKQEMTELRDTFNYLLENWGKPDVRESHPESGN